MVFASSTPSHAAQVPGSPTPVSSALHNSFVKVTREKKLKIVVVGNSVTHGAPAGALTNPSFYVALGNWFKTRFPEANIEVVPKIIFAIGPEVQLFRMDENVIAQKPDLVLAEFGAANGAWGEAGRAITEPATEGFVRRLRFMLPRTDCVLQLGLFKTMMDAYGAGQTPASVSFLRDVARKYQCALGDGQAELARRIQAGEPWETYMKDAIHPSPRGYAVHSEVLVAELERQWALFQAMDQDKISAVPHPFPLETLHADPWLFPRLVPAYFAQKLDKFTLAETGDLKYIRAREPLASWRFQVPGARIVGVYLRSPEGRGNLEIKQGDAWVKLSQRNEPRFTEAGDPANYYQRNFFQAYGLPADKDSVEFRVSPDPEIAGNYEVQIVGFFVVEKVSTVLPGRPL